MDQRERPRGVGRIAAALATLAILSGCATTPSVIPTGSPTDPSPSPEPGHARLVAYVDEGDLWLYDVAADAVTRLTDDGDAAFEGHPLFLDQTHVAYTRWSGDPGASSIRSVSIDGRATRDLVRGEGTIFDLDLSPDGSTLAYASIDYDGDSRHVVKLVDGSGGDPTAIRDLGPPPGRGGSSEDDVSLAWSPDGGSILVTNTAISAVDDPEVPERTPSIFVLDRDGDDVLDPWRGTHARWWSDGEAILYRGYAGEMDNAWFAAWPTTKGSTRSKPLPMRPGVNNLVLAPEGDSLVGYDTSWFGDVPPGLIRFEDPRVYFHGVGGERLVAQGAIKPLWISPDELLVTDVKPAGPRANTLNSWEWLGTASKITLDGERKPVTLTSTWDAVSLFE